MLYVIQKKDGREHVQEWHIGEPLPQITEAVVVFQADGDELETMVNGMVVANAMQSENMLARHARMLFQKLTRAQMELWNKVTKS